MGRPPQTISKSNQIATKGRDEHEKKIIKAFKEVCWRDGLEMNGESIKLYERFLHEHNWPPGNPQKMLIQFGEVHEESTGLVQCDVRGCREEAVWRCDTVFPYGRFRNFCWRHTSLCERRGELRGKKRL